jgi:peroxiredoxin
MRSRPSPRAIFALAAVAAFTIWISWRAKALELGTRRSGAPSVLLGKPAPDFALESLDGRKISLADYHGRRLVVTFWASWCGPCRLELPVLAKFYQQTHQPGSDFEVLAISIDTTKDAAQGASRTLKIPFPVLLDADSHFADSYHVDAIPTLFVIDKAGKVAFSHTGFEMGFDFLLAQQLDIKNYTPTAGGKQ